MRRSRGHSRLVRCSDCLEPNNIESRQISLGSWLYHYLEGEWPTKFNMYARTWFPHRDWCTRAWTDLHSYIYSLKDCSCIKLSLLGADRGLIWSKMTQFQRLTLYRCGMYSGHVAPRRGHSSDDNRLVYVRVWSSSVSRVQQEVGRVVSDHTRCPAHWPGSLQVSGQRQRWPVQLLQHHATR